MARGLAAEAGGELFTYDGSDHLFTDRSLDVYRPDAARLVMQRTLDFLARLTDDLQIGQSVG